MIIFYNKNMNILSMNRVAFTIFGVDIYWYGVIISSAILVAYVVSLFLAKMKHKDSEICFELLIAIVPLGIAFARLFAVLFDEGLSIANYFDFRSGGMSIIGAIIGGLNGLIILKFIKKRSIREAADLIVVVLILAQGIGRWGNYVNGEIYGELVENPDLQFFPYSVLINGSYYEALFFYEFVLDILGFIGLLMIYKHVNIKGVTTASYLMYYGIIRAILETRRAPQFVLMIGSVPFSLLMSILMAVVGAGLLTWVLVKNFKDKKKMENTNGR